MVKGISKRKPKDFEVEVEINEKSKKKKTKHKNKTQGGGDGKRKSLAAGTRHTRDGKVDKKKPRSVPERNKPYTTEVFKYLGLNLEWNSLEVKSHQLSRDGFRYCIVLAVEDSAELTPVGRILHNAVKTGLRKRFVSISGEEIAQKVKKYMTGMNKYYQAKDDQAFLQRMDIWAEALKHTLIQFKKSATSKLRATSKLEVKELIGTRPKDFVQHGLPYLKNSPSQYPSEDQLNEIILMESTECTPRKEQGQGDGQEHHIKWKDRMMLNKNSALVKPKILLKGRSSNMRKRGELPMPTFEEVDDAPPKGPHTYILLQGFYNPKILEELLKIGVNVDGILLMTKENAGGKRNFSFIDIEDSDSIAGIFRPHNIRDVVGKFWAGLAEIYNTAPVNSPLLDFALMNFVLPKNEHGLESPEARGIYASKLFDEASQRIYEMWILNAWFQKFHGNSNRRSLMSATNPRCSLNYAIGLKDKKRHEEPVKTESFKYLGSDAEWNSEDIKRHQLLTNGFTYYIVMFMEDSANLSPMGQYLHHAVATGVRKRIISIRGQDIAQKVTRYITSTKSNVMDNQDIWERMDIWAEALKHTLIQLKCVESKRMEIELTGARSKDFVQQFCSVLPLALKRTAPLSEDQLNETYKLDGIIERLPTPSKSKGKFNKPPLQTVHHRKNKNLTFDNFKPSNESIHKPFKDSDAVNSIKARSSNMRKRGELPMSSLEEIDDSPPKGPHIYILLQGFYNPNILHELLKIGVNVDGILLMTDDTVAKRTISFIDIEDSIPEAIRPHSILPNYLKYVEHQQEQKIDNVGQFWARLAEIYNKAQPPLLDLALKNFVLPKNEHGLETPKARGIYASQLFDEASQRIYEMFIRSAWFHDYTGSSK